MQTPVVLYAILRTLSFHLQEVLWKATVSGCIGCSLCWKLFWWLKTFKVGNNRNMRQEQHGASSLIFFPREGKGVPDFDLVPFLPPASACMFVQLHVWRLDYCLWCPWNISHLRKSVGGNRNRTVWISRSKDYRSLPYEHICVQDDLYKGLKS